MTAKGKETLLITGGGAKLVPSEFTGWCARGTVRRWVTIQEVTWDIGLPNSGWRLAIPSDTGFESSIPRLLHWLIDPDDPRFLLAALVHDVLLERGYKPAFADSQWVEAAMSECAPSLKIKLAYVAMVVRRMVKWKRP